MARKGQGGRWFVYFLLQQVQRVGTYVAPVVAPSEPAAQISVLIGDWNGRVLAEVEPNVGPVSWRLNKVGKVTLTFSKTDPKATETLLRYNNRVLIQFPNGLPPWGGVLTPPRTWSEVLTVTAESAETLLGRRTTDRGRYFDKATVGYIFQRLIGEANAVWPTGVEVGTVWGGGSLHSPSYHLKTVLDLIQKSICGRLSTAEFAVIPSLEDGHIKFRANLYERRGGDRPNVALLEGRNLSMVTLEEQGDLVNYYRVVGAGSTWGPERPAAEDQDNDSVQAYGYWEDARVFSSISETETLEETITGLLNETAQPRKILSLEVTNVTPALYSQYDVGDRVWVSLYSYGFDGYEGLVRVLAREFDPGTGVCKLVVQA